MTGPVCGGIPDCAAVGLQPDWKAQDQLLVTPHVILQHLLQGTHVRRTPLAGLIAMLFVCAPLGAQATPPAGMVHTPGMQHTPGMEHPPGAPQPLQGGQAAFAAITEIVQLLEADSTTDWSKVDLEALRQHLIDMDAVTLRARVKHLTTPAGLTLDITGDVLVAASIRRMVGAHAPMVEALGGWRASATAIPGGMRFTVVASNTKDTATINRIRGLGFIGLMTQGAHHAQHHLAIAKGGGAHAHGGK